MSMACYAKAPSIGIKLAAASPQVYLCDPERNADGIIKAISRADEAGCDYLALPELCLTGATAGTLMSSPLVLAQSRTALERICSETRDTRVTAAIGLPYEMAGALRSCAAIIRAGRVYAIVPAAIPRAPFGFLPALEYSDVAVSALTPVAMLCVHFAGRLFLKPDPVPASITLMPSSLNATARSLEDVLSALCTYSARSGSAVVYAAPGKGESTSAFVFDGLCAIAANGEIVAQCAPFCDDAFVTAEIDLGALMPFEPYEAPFNKFETYLSADEKKAHAECERILELQSEALIRRMTHIHAKGFVVGVSGGLDSALALTVCARALDKLNMDRTCALGVSMPGFGSSERTKSNARALIEAFGMRYREISVVPSCKQHFTDIGHDVNDTSVVFENAQARERTQILLDIANMENLLDVGTGDLSESALGFTTFGGDHLAQYGVNASVPKTVIRKVVSIACERYPEAAQVLSDILATPVSPELLPTENGEIAQKTEELIGSYELHDFFLYHMIVNGKSPKKLYSMAQSALSFPDCEVYRVLGIFLRRFFASQFKRSCAPESPIVLNGISTAVFTMPSDMDGAAWIREYESIETV